MAGPSARLADTERMDHMPCSRINSTTAPNLTITEGIKESKAIGEDLDIAKLTKVQSQLARENKTHALPADVIMREMDEMHR